MSYASQKKKKKKRRRVEEGKEKHQHKYGLQNKKKLKYLHPNYLFVLLQYYTLRQQIHLQQT